ncbi:MAG TPA: LysR family transcriptional regulator [Polyangiales bacterium]|nr:LysR family transcriptional regulator [Polyangiales bacterium]
MLRIDLNLFTVFDAIYREGGITAASKQLHLSQPAVSHALARLRELLGDPLFERQGNAMVPTPRARTLAGTIRSSLGGLEQLLASEVSFDPADAQRSFVIAMREAHESSFLPALASTLAERPGIDVAAVRIERRDLEDDLQSGEIDLALDVGLPLSAEIKRERVKTSPLAVLARRDHPQVQGGALDLDTYLALDHVLVTGRRRGGGFEDLALARLNHTRRVRVRCQLHAAANELVRRSDLLLTLPRNHAEQLSESTGNQVVAFPVEVASFELFLYWHANVDGEPANQWFRQRVRECLGAK